MEVIKTNIPDLLLIQPKVFSDDRGYFFESWNQHLFEAADLNLNFLQDNESQSSRGTLRGIHLQIAHPQGKLVRVSAGEVFDVAVDLRPNSKTLGQWQGFNLSEKNKTMLWVPPGFGHAFLTLSDRATFNYKCTEVYYPDDQHTLAWDDSRVKVQWPLDQDELQLSEKDAAGDSLNQIMEKISA